MINKEESLEILEDRLKESLDGSDITRSQTLQKAIKLVKETDLPDYEIFTDIGMRLINKPSHHTFTEYLIDGEKKVTHFEGDKKWTTYETFIETI